MWLPTGNITFYENMVHFGNVIKGRIKSYIEGQDH